MNPEIGSAETIRIVKSIAVPPEKVYEAFIKPEQLVRWIGPGGPQATRVEVDAGIGGATDIWIAKEEGEKHHFHWETIEADPPNRLVLDFTFGATAGEELTNERSRLTLEFREDAPGSTELSLVHDRLPAGSPVENFKAGWITITDRLAKDLEGKEAS